MISDNTNQSNSPSDPQATADSNPEVGSDADNDSPDGQPINEGSEGTDDLAQDIILPDGLSAQEIAAATGAPDASAETAESTAQPAAEVPVNEAGQTSLLDAEGSIAIAMVQGEAVTELPKDLYIPPDALRVFLETFSGPLDLLLYLIRRQNLDILEIKVAEITRQYMQYIELMSALQLELAGEYLVMAAMLAEIKSRMLLPKPVSDDEDDTDPRAELVRRLQEYEQFKTAGENVEAMPRMERDIFPIAIEPPDLVSERPQPTVELKELLVAFAEVLHRADMFARHAIHMEPLSVRERMTQLLSKLKHSTDFVPFADFFTVEEGRSGVVVSFLAMMELVREGLVDIVQNEAFAPIYLRASSEERTQKFGLYSAEDGGDQALVEAADESAFEEADATEADDSALAEKASATGAADSSLQDEQPDGASESKTD